MPQASLSERLKASALIKPSAAPHDLNAARDMSVFRSEDGLQGKIKKGRGVTGRARSGALGGAGGKP